MTKKLGRPTIPKGQAKTDFLGVFVNRQESKTIHNAITESGQSKSKWIRDALLEQAQPSPTSNPEGSILYFREASLLNSDNLVLAIGAAQIYPKLGSGEFFPQTHYRKILDTLPQSSTTLQVSDGRLYSKLKLERLPCPAKNKPLHFHFDFEKV